MCSSDLDLKAQDLALQMHHELARELAREGSRGQSAAPQRPETPAARDAGSPARPAADRALDETRTDRAPEDLRAPDDSRPDRSPAAAGSAEGSTSGGTRAALRAEREAAEAARRKAGKKGPAGPAGTGPDASAGRARGPRRAVQLVLAMVVVALVVLGVWSFTSQDTKTASAQSGTSHAAAAPSASASASAGVPTPEATAPAESVAPAVPAAPVRAPVTVLNGTRIGGLAKKVGDKFGAAGWQLEDSGNYPGTDISVTTVYYKDGDATQLQAATELVAEFPDVKGPAPRFFDVPGVADPGLVVVATGDWKP